MMSADIAVRNWSDALVAELQQLQQQQIQQQQEAAAKAAETAADQPVSEPSGKAERASKKRALGADQGPSETVSASTDAAMPGAAKISGKAFNMGLVVASQHPVRAHPGLRSRGRAMPRRHRAMPSRRRAMPSRRRAKPGAGKISGQAFSLGLVVSGQQPLSAHPVLPSSRRALPAAGKISQAFKLMSLAPGHDLPAIPGLPDRGGATGPEAAVSKEGGLISLVPAAEAMETESATALESAAMDNQLDSSAVELPAVAADSLVGPVKEEPAPKRQAAQASGSSQAAKTEALKVGAVKPAVGLLGALKIPKEWLAKMRKK